MLLLEHSRSTFTILSHPSHLVFWQRLQLARLRFGLEARNNTLEQTWWMWYGKYPSIYILIIYLLTRSLQVPTKYRCFKFSQWFFLLDEFFINTMGADCPSVLLTGETNVTCKYVSSDIHCENMQYQLKLKDHPATYHNCANASKVTTDESDPNASIWIQDLFGALKDPVQQSCMLPQACLRTHTTNVVQKGSCNFKSGWNFSW